MMCYVFLSLSKYLTSCSTGTLGLPGMTLGAGGAVLACASFVCFRRISGSTNLADVGVVGILTLRSESLSADLRLRPNLSVDRDRKRVLSGAMGAGAKMLLCVDAEAGPLYID